MLTWSTEVQLLKALCQSLIIKDNLWHSGGHLKGFLTKISFFTAFSNLIYSRYSAQFHHWTKTLKDYIFFNKSDRFIILTVVYWWPIWWLVQLLHAPCPESSPQSYPTNTQYPIFNIRLYWSESMWLLHLYNIEHLVTFHLYMVPQICYITVAFGTRDLLHYCYIWYQGPVSLLLHLVHGPVTLLLHFVLWTCYIRYFKPVTLGSLNL